MKPAESEDISAGVVIPENKKPSHKHLSFLRPILLPLDFHLNPALGWSLLIGEIIFLLHLMLINRRQFPKIKDLCLPA